MLRLVFFVVRLKLSAKVSLTFFQKNKCQLIQNINYVKQNWFFSCKLRLENIVAQTSFNNCNNILFTKLHRPGDSKRTVWSLKSFNNLQIPLMLKIFSVNQILHQCSNMLRTSSVSKERGLAI